MTKRQLEKYHRNWKDVTGKPLKVGDIVAVGYCSMTYLGMIHHFGQHTAVIMYKAHRGNVIWRGQKRPEYILKLDLDYSKYPELYNVLDSYGKTICKMQEV